METQANHKQVKNKGKQGYKAMKLLKTTNK